VKGKVKGKSGESEGEEHEKAIVLVRTR
jgi:hypothetical protein